GPYAELADQVRKGFAAIVPPEADVAAVADAIVTVVDTPFGQRPFRVHVDPTQDGAEVVNAVSNRVRAELRRRIGRGDLLVPWVLAPPSHGADSPCEARSGPCHRPCTEPGRMANHNGKK